MKRLIATTLLAVAVTAQAAPGNCPKTMAPAVEAKLIPVLQARDQAIQKKDWFDSQYENAIETLLQAHDAASREARVALMDYYVGEAYKQELECAVAFGGKTVIPLLERYSRCDIVPAHAKSVRDHALPLRAATLKMLKDNTVGENCNFD